MSPPQEIGLVPVERTRSGPHRQKGNGYILAGTALPARGWDGRSRRDAGDAVIPPQTPPNTAQRGDEALEPRPVTDEQTFVVRQRASVNPESEPLCATLATGKATMTWSYRAHRQLDRGLQAYATSTLR